MQPWSIEMGLFYLVFGIIGLCLILLVFLILYSNRIMK